MDRLAGQREVTRRHKRQHPSRLFSRRVVTVVLLLAVQAAFPIVGLYVLSDYFIYVNTILRILSIAVTIYIFNRPGNPEYKLAWVIPILIFPLFGGLLYILYRLQASIKHLRLRLLAILEATQPCWNRSRKRWNTAAGKPLRRGPGGLPFAGRGISGV